MPELPEVETTRRGIAPHVEGRRVAELVVREPRLRWPVDPELPARLAGTTLGPVARRAKYLLLPAGEAGTLILHLGMSGSLRVIDAAEPPAAHDHLDLVLDDGQALRLRDPRRFGAALWQPAGSTHPRLADLGPEPLGPDFNGDYLYRTSRGRRAAVKAFIMDNK
ncbi:MAG: DNA-formamidopyrimidine glycosylase family protein, partial [Pseudomonadota bacterium]